MSASSNRLITRAATPTRHLELWSALSMLAPDQTDEFEFLYFDALDHIVRAGYEYALPRVAEWWKRRSE